MFIDKDSVFRNSALTHRLEILANEAIRANDSLFVEQTGCTIREYRVLRMIDEHGGIAFNEIMHITGLDRSLVSRLIRTLLERELIYRVNSKEDARRFGLFTTDSGKTTCERGRRLSAAAEEILFSPLLGDELQQLNDLLDKLVIWVRSPDYNAQLQDMQDMSTSFCRAKKQQEQSG
ncbi:MAG: MarR family winged helix-turn-helix transcriptional regulator [Thiolinea sp.]